jgi:serine carboxypeptidase-like clade II
MHFICLVSIIGYVSKGKFLNQLPLLLSKKKKDIRNYESFLSFAQQVGEHIDVCVEDETINYLNRKDVQEALHAELNGVPKWGVCSRLNISLISYISFHFLKEIYNFRYTNSNASLCFSVLNYDFLNLRNPTITIVGSLVKSGIRVLVYRYISKWISQPLFFFSYQTGDMPALYFACQFYNLFLLRCSGDQDSVIPLTGSRTLVHNLANQIGLKATVPYRVWFEGKQVNTVCKLKSFLLAPCSSQLYLLVYLLFLLYIRLVDGHKCTEICYLLQQ